MDSEITSDFWAVSAQVVPVLALAQVIEVRAFARQMTSKKKQFHLSIWRRVSFVVSAAFVAVLLTTSFVVALNALTGGDAGPSQAFIIIYALSVATILVVLAPLLAVLRGLVGDVPSRLRLWRGERRIAAVRNQLAEVIPIRRRALLEGLLQRRSEMAEQYVISMMAWRTAARVTTPDGRRTQREVEDHLNRLDAYRSRIDAFVRDERAKLADAEALISDQTRIVSMEVFDGFRKALKDLE